MAVGEQTVVSSLKILFLLNSDNNGRNDSGENKLWEFSQDWRRYEKTAYDLLAPLTWVYALLWATLTEHHAMGNV